MALDGFGLTFITGSKAVNHVVLMMWFTEFRAGIRPKHVRK